MVVEYCPFRRRATGKSSTLGGRLLVGIIIIRVAKSADRADRSVLFFLAGANFWEKHAKTVLLCLFWTIFGLFWTYYLVLIFWGGNWSVLIFTPFATM